MNSYKELKNNQGYFSFSSNIKLNYAKLLN